MPTSDYPLKPFIHSIHHQYASVSLAEVARHVSYDPETGFFTRLTGYGPAIKAGTRAGGQVSRSQSRQLVVNGVRYREEVLAWYFGTGKMPAGTIFHLNGDPSDNRLENLFDYTFFDEQDRGAFYRPKTGDWEVLLATKGGGARKSYGTFTDRETALHTADQLAHQLAIGTNPARLKSLLRKEVPADQIAIEVERLNGKGGNQAVYVVMSFSPVPIKEPEQKPEETEETDSNEPPKDVLKPWSFVDYEYHIGVINSVIDVTDTKSVEELLKAEERGPVLVDPDSLRVSWFITCLQNDTGHKHYGRPYYGPCETREDAEALVEKFYLLRETGVTKAIALEKLGLSVYFKQGKHLAPAAPKIAKKLTGSVREPIILPVLGRKDNLVRYVVVKLLDDDKFTMLTLEAELKYDEASVEQALLIYTLNRSQGESVAQSLDASGLRPYNHLLEETSELDLSWSDIDAPNKAAKWRKNHPKLAYLGMVSGIEQWAIKNVPVGTRKNRLLCHDCGFFNSRKEAGAALSRFLAASKDNDIETALVLAGLNNKIKATYRRGKLGGIAVTWDED